MQQSDVGKAEHGWRVAALVVLALGLLFRVVYFAQGQDLWLDEATVALNVVQRDFAGLAKPLDYGQVAPMGFLWLTRATVLVLGENAYSLRLLPLLAGCAALPLFWRLTRFAFPQSAGAQLFALWIFAFNDILVRYSAEVKPYGFDALFCILILHQGARWVAKADGHTTLALAAILVVAPWFSFSSVFLLAGVAVVMLAMLGRRSNRDRLLAVFTVLGLGFASFLAHYLAFTRRRATSGLIDLWADSYLSWLPHSMAELKHTGDLLASTLTGPVGLTSVGIGCVLLVISAVRPQRSVRVVLLIFVIALAGAVALSTLRLYPWTDRLLLFVVPGFALWLASGMLSLWEMCPAEKTRRLWLTAIIWIGCITWPLFYLGLRAVRPFADQGITRVMQAIEQRNPDGAVLYVDNDSMATFLIYNRWRQYDKRFTIHSLDDSMRLANGDKQVWLLFPDVFIGGPQHREAVLKSMDSRGTKADAIELLKSAAYQYRLP